jgi:riboflavin-specific deaminase-like protein
LKRPFVLAHFAITADGRINTPAQLASRTDRRRLQETRAAADAVLAGRGTAEADNMNMGLSAKDLRESRKANGRSPVPLRVMVSNSGHVDLDGRVFSYSASPLVVFSTSRMPESMRTGVARRADLFLFPGETVDLPGALQILRADFGVKRLVCEGGGTLLRALAEGNLVDGIRLTVAPKVLGGSSAPTLTGLPADFLKAPRAFRIIRQSVEGNECVLDAVRAGFPISHFPFRIFHP